MVFSLNDPPYQGKQALAEVFLYVREEAGFTNWDEFSDALYRETKQQALANGGRSLYEDDIDGLVVAPQQFERVAGARYSKEASPIPIRAIVEWGGVDGPRTFRLRNGDIISMDALYDVLYGTRDSKGQRKPRDTA